MKPKASSYPQLKADLLRLLQEGQVKAMEQIQELRVQTYWKMGQRLHQTPEIKDQATIPADWLAKLSEALGLARATFYRILQFYRTYPKGLPKTKGQKTLSWTSHLALLPLQDEKERSYYLQKAAEQSWTEKQLRDALNQNLYQASQLPTDKTAVGATGRSPKKLQRPTTGLYLYQAVVERVIDGDTLLVNLDLGFDVWKKQRLRLRAIDCAELKTPEGQVAKSFVEEVLQPVEFVILKTYKMDLHGRFVCDVFFAPAEKDKQKIFAEGTFLNQLLVEQGQAVVVG